jgi:hypothetical protein
VIKALEQGDPLSQVCFVHDYLQLVFQEYGLSIFNPVRINLNTRRYIQGDPGFCDALVSLIGQKVVNVSMIEQQALLLSFEAGGSVSVSLATEDASGPEAFRFDGPKDSCVVEQNA